MIDSSKRREESLEWWGKQDLASKRAYWDAWYPSEVAFIRGLIHRATFVPPKTDGRVLQIGAGPFDVIDYWGEGERHAIDPAAEGYKELARGIRDEGVNYIEGFGEKLPYEDGYFDIVIVRNALDHTEDAPRVLQEVYRVLKPTGAVYMWFYLFSPRAALEWRLINALTGRYASEPWAFTRRSIAKHLARAGLRPAFPAVEERPRPELQNSASLVVKMRAIARKMLDFDHRKAFYCVCLPEKPGAPKPVC